MSAVTASPYWTLLFVAFVSAERKTITAESGQDVTLTCRAPNNNNIKFLHWTRDDLGDKYVLLYRDGHFDPANKHPSFKNRVDLRDRQMKDGDVSLILKDVTINDTGTYECRVYMEETHSWELISSTNLVVPPEPNIITAESGQDVTLTCRAPNSKIRGVVWSRTDKAGFVLLYQDGQFIPDNQPPSFKNRVDLQDRQMKDGDVSLILKDVTTDDSGTYMCNVLTQRTGSLKLISIIYLSVPPGILGGYPVWMVALIVCVVLLLATLLFLIFIFLTYTKIQKQRIKLRGKSAGFSKLNSESPPAVPRSDSYPTRRKKDDQGQKETADLHLQSP